MRRIAVVLVLVLMAAVWPVAGLGYAAQAAPAVTPASLQADFNNDGADDLAVGVPTESVGSISRAGAVNVLYGSASGLSGTGSQLFTQDTPGVVGRAEPGDDFGAAVAAGDFDNDGFADLAVGVDLEDAGAVADVGAVNVLYGSASGLSGRQLFTQVAGAVEAGDRFGFALATGDFDDDGFADLAAGAPLENAATAVDAGAVSVLYGSASGLDGSGSQQFIQVAGAVEAGDRFGFALASGDFNNNGFADLAVGAPLEDAGTAVDAGAVSVLYGSAGRLTASGGQLFTQVAGAVEAGDRFGSAVAAGDFNNNGFADLGTGAPLEDVGATVDAGALSEIPGSASGLTTSGGRIHTERSFTGPQASDQFGFALASGDFGNNGFADLAVGIPGENIEPPPATIPDVGAVNVFSGTPDGLFASFEDQHLQPSNPERGDRFGAAVAAGDFTNDGSADLAASAPLEDVGTTVDAGAVSVLSGPVIGLSSETFTQDAAGVAGSAEAGDRFGAALAVGEPAP